MADMNYDRPIPALLRDAAKLVGTAAYRLRVEMDGDDPDGIVEVTLIGTATLLDNIASRLGRP